MPARKCNLPNTCSNCHNDVLPSEEIAGKLCKLDPMPKDNDSGECIGFVLKRQSDVVHEESKFYVFR